MAVTAAHRRRVTLRQRQGRLLLRAAALVAAVVALKSFVIDPLGGHFSGSLEDFSAYLSAARAMAAGGSPYAHFASNTVVLSGFIYPPFAALLVRPLALFSDHVAAMLWVVLGLACALAGSLTLARTALPAVWPRTELAVLSALAFAPATYNYWHGQINPLIFLLLALAYRAYARNQETFCGALIGVAAAIKLAPLVLVVLLLRRGWWRGSFVALAGCGASAALGVAALGPDVTRVFFATVFPALNRASGWIYNQSLTGAVSRVAEHSVLQVGVVSPVVQAAGLVAAAGALIIAVPAVSRDERPASERGLEFGAAVTAMLLAASLAWFPQSIALLIPLFAVLGVAATRSQALDRRLSRAAAAVALVYGAAVPLAISALSLAWIEAASHSPAWWFFLQLCSLPCAASLWLLVSMVTASRRRGGKILVPLRT
jgi:alpha-1,2-mannosyltransferase